MPQTIWASVYSPHRRQTGNARLNRPLFKKGFSLTVNTFARIEKSNDSNFSLLTNKIRSDSFSFSLNTRKEEKKHENNKKVEKVTGSSIFLLSAITTNILPLSEPVFSHKNNFFCAICCCLYVCCCCCCCCCRCCNFQTLSNDCDLCLNNLFPTFGNKLLKF